MKLFLLLLLVGCAAAFAQSGGQAGAKPNAQSGAQPAPANTGAPLHARAREALDAEHAHAKQPLCRTSADTPSYNRCYQRELNLSEANYTRLVRALGALFRLDQTSDGPPKRIPFDDAESAWNAYRDAACQADAAQYKGGTIQPSIEMGCRITIVRHHMDELWELYSNLGTQ